MGRDYYQHVEGGWAAYRIGRYESAEREAREALARAPTEPEALSLLSLCAMQRKDLKNAVRLAEEAIGYSPAEAGYHYRLALVHARCGDHISVDLPLQRAIELDPQLAPAHALYGAVYLARDEFGLAYDAVMRALEIDPLDSYALNLRIDILKRQGLLREARRAALDALEIDPENAQAHAMAGTLKLGSDRHGALDHLREALRLAPERRWVQRVYTEALEGRNAVARGLLKLSRSLTLVAVDSYCIWLALWVFYLLSRANRGTPMEWPPIFFAAAITLHVLLVLAWWGPLLSYAMLKRDSEVRRVVAAERSLRDRTRVGRWWHAVMTIAILVSVAGLFLPGERFAPLVTALAGVSMALWLVEAASGRLGKSLAGTYAIFVLAMAAAWVYHPATMRNDKGRKKLVLAELFPVAAIVAASVAFGLSEVAKGEDD